MDLSVIVSGILVPIAADDVQTAHVRLVPSPVVPDVDGPAALLFRCAGRDPSGDIVVGKEGGSWVGRLWAAKSFQDRTDSHNSGANIEERYIFSLSGGCDHMAQRRADAVEGGIDATVTIAQPEDATDP